MRKPTHLLNPERLETQSSERSPGPSDPRPFYGAPHMNPRTHAGEAEPVMRESRPPQPCQIQTRLSYRLLKSPLLTTLLSVAAFDPDLEKTDSASESSSRSANDPRTDSAHPDRSQHRYQTERPTQERTEGVHVTSKQPEPQERPSSIEAKAQPPPNSRANANKTASHT